MEADVLHRSSSLFQHSVQLTPGGSKNLQVVDIQEIGDFDSYRLIIIIIIIIIIIDKTQADCSSKIKTVPFSN